MIQGFYASAAGMLAQLDRQDIITNNLANANTPGFKRTSVSFSTELKDATKSPATATGKISCVVPRLIASVDHSPGAIQDTADLANFAIDGNGSFVVNGPNGEQFTRSGNFKLDNSGKLVTTEGLPVLGQNGEVQIQGTKWSVDPEGNVSVNGAIVDKLRVETAAGTKSPSQAARILQGSLEGSNVNVVQEMVEMITALRAYEANQKAIQSMDQTLDKAINQMGR